MMLISNFKEGFVINPLNVVQVSIRPLQDTTRPRGEPAGIEFLFIAPGATISTRVPFEMITDRKKREAAKKIFRDPRAFEEATKRLAMKWQEGLMGQGIMLLEGFIDYVLYGE